MATRVIFVSDTHLSPDAPEAQANWATVVGYIAAVNPDLVVHLGDLSMDGARNPTDLDHARRQLELLPVPWHAVPGNHDVGDNPLPNMADSLAVNDARRERWLDVVGPDWWSVEVSGWLLLAVNAQLVSSGLAAEASQWSWLGDQIARADEGLRIALLSHKPLAVAEPELAAAPTYRFWPPAARERLADLFGAGRPALAVSGHVHQSRRLSLGGVDHLWVPTTWAVLPDHAQPVLGNKRAGVMSLTFGPGLPPSPHFAEPAGIRQLILTADIPDPYAAERHAVARANTPSATVGPI